MEWAQSTSCSTGKTPLQLVWPLTSQPCSMQTCDRGCGCWPHTVPIDLSSHGASCLSVYPLCMYACVIKRHFYTRQTGVSMSWVLLWAHSCWNMCVPTSTSMYWLTTVSHLIPANVTDSFTLYDLYWVTRVLWLKPLPAFFSAFNFVYQPVYSINLSCGFMSVTHS